MNKDIQIGLSGLAIRAAVAHTITYFLAGIVAAWALNYAEQLSRPEMACWMRQISDPMVMAGPLFLLGALFLINWIYRGDLRTRP